MRKLASDHLRQWLPELYGPADAPKKPGGMCSPGSGCDPARDASAMDIVRILTDAGRTSSGEKAPSGKIASGGEETDQNDSDEGQ
ncbi:MAG: hypothetical protein C4519_21435 [Desulfobacteraceae bacterium]|nr:MAG: hypothetical protein C4519_21435 [Desulfobacteraceae bacterium]